MIDISKKKETHRTAKAQAQIILNSELIEKIKKNKMPKGNVLEIARTAGIIAAKKTPDLIPLCHNIEISKVDIDYKFHKTSITVTANTKAYAKTGVEMESLIACSLAALTIYDMCKMFKKDIIISDIELQEKKGGKHGIYQK